MSSDDSQKELLSPSVSPSWTPRPKSRRSVQQMMAEKIRVGTSKPMKRPTADVKRIESGQKDLTIMPSHHAKSTELKAPSKTPDAPVEIFPGKVQEYREGKEERIIQEPKEFENLGQCAKQCLIYCSLFPFGYEFEKETLVQLWAAEGIEERDAASCFQVLARWEYIVASRFDYSFGHFKYKVNESKASSWYNQRGLFQDRYLRIEEGKLDNSCTKALHLSLHCKKLDPTEFEALRNCQQLRTLLLLGDSGSSIKQIPRELFLCLSSLRTLDLSRTHISVLPTSVGYLESLRYLNISYTPIKVLPESIDCLCNLQTLNLRSCFALRALPEGMRKLITLEHLDFDIVRQLNSMPKRMGTLTKLQTLKAFLVGTDEGCSIAELENLNRINGSFCICRLENVANVEEAKKATLSNKKYITKLKLRWGDLRNNSSDDEKEILECLQPNFSLKELEILFYSGTLLPSWISNPKFIDIISITLYNCKNCYLLPSLGELPSLRFLKVVEMISVRDINHLFCRNGETQGSVAFPRLEKLTINNMLNLEEWTGVENGDFPCLLHMSIQWCPKLKYLPLLSHCKALRYLEISYCSALESLPQEGLPASLETLVVRDCPIVKQRCLKDRREDWPKIAHVPSIWIDLEQISGTEVGEESQPSSI